MDEHQFIKWVALPIGVIGGFAVAASISIGSKKDRILNDVFKSVSLPKAQEGVIKHVIKTEKGNCTLLNSDLTPICEQVKTAALKLGYEAK